MAAQQTGGWNRREFIGAATLLALAVGVPVSAIELSKLPDESAPTEAQRAMMREVSQQVLPRTATAGAGDVGVGDFVILALAHGLENSRRPVGAGAMPALLRFRATNGTLRHIDWLEDALNRASSIDFVKLPAEQRRSKLAALDAEAYAKGADGHPWRTIKALILTGYYTSEVGGAQELRYELVPGRWDPDLPLKPGDRAWSSDWTAVDFG